MLRRSRPLAGFASAFFAASRTAGFGGIGRSGKRYRLAVLSQIQPSRLTGNLARFLAIDMQPTNRRSGSKRTSENFRQHLRGAMPATVKVRNDFLVEPGDRTRTDKLET